ncbi:MAG: DUF1565 domain-containing protein [Bradymonadia bacterium]
MKKRWLIFIFWALGCSTDDATSVPENQSDGFVPGGGGFDQSIASRDGGSVPSILDRGFARPSDAGDAGIAQSMYGDPCRSNADCVSGYCIASPRGFLCSQLCGDDADCADVAGPMGCYLVDNFGPDRFRICTPAAGNLCQPCFRDDHCFSGRCIEGPVGNVCSVDCGKDDECPARSECQTEDATGQSFDVPQCIPDIAFCDCSEDQAGETRACVRTAEGFDGRCFGEETCQPGMGWSGCNAPEPTAEACDGIDNDCNGAIDDGLPIGEPCANENEFGRCAGTRLCNGAEGWTCIGPEPVEERCDALDNDCDGLSDEGFTNGEGFYLSAEHCGACNVACADLYPLATATDCTLIDGEPACIITACREGFALAGPTLCVPLASRICEPCERDVDCNNALGDRCIEYDGGSRFCGRSCADDSPFGPECPDGFSCDASGQCRLDVGSCLCAPNDNFILPCTVTSPLDGQQRCVGTQVCAAGELSRCELPGEICDNFDDDCDGTVDEDFIDAETGGYTTDAHCGRCNNDCVGRLAGNAVNGQGYCDPSGDEPRCGIRCDDGFVDINGVLADGCECRLLDADADAPDADGIDANCDGIDGEVPRGIFVSPTGDDNADGTRRNPLRTIQVGIERARPRRNHVYVAAGVYAETITLRTGVSVFGGYSADFSRRDLDGNETALFPPLEVEGERLGTVTAIDIVEEETRLTGFTIVGHAENIPGRSSYAVYVRDCGENLILENNNIRAGSGGSGLRGQSGTPGLDAPDNATEGEQESFARFAECIENAQVPNRGGRGGRNECRPPNGAAIVTNGGDGGAAGCPTFDRPEQPGQDGVGDNNGGAGGVAGYNQQLVEAQTGCACLVPQTPGATEVGIPGQSGGVGRSGNAGAGCGNGFGRIVNGQWLAGGREGPAESGGGDGQSGGPGGGGGGGGAGSGVEHGGSFCNLIFDEVMGGGGGGGGAGGCGGLGGTGGTSGGGAFGIFVFYTQPGLSVPIFRANLIERGFGGSGGDGGEGGEGGSGALGKAALALAGDDREDLLACADPGGRGGDGGAGGDGAGGGGGCGGLSAGIFYRGVEVADLGQWRVQNIFPGTGAAGLGGRGGLSLTNRGQDGADGDYVEVAQ